MIDLIIGFVIAGVLFVVEYLCKVEKSFMGRHYSYAHSDRHYLDFCKW